MRINLISKVNTSSSYYDEVDRASFRGITLKTLFLLFLTIAVGVMVALVTSPLIEDMENRGKLTAFFALLIVSAIVSLICGIAGRFDTRASKYFAAIYELSEGIMLGFITRLVERFFPGVGFICIGATVLIFSVVLLMYVSGIVKASSVLFKIVITIFITTIVLSIFTLIMALTTGITKEYLMISIIIEVLMLVYAVIILVFNFEEANSIVKSGCAKNSEWCVALGLEVTLVFIYVELLRLAMLIMEYSKR